MNIETIYGLPAHPLIVHGAVVLLPLAAVGAVVVAALPRARRHYAPLVLVAAVAALGAVWLAEQSGEALEDRVEETALVEEHAEQGDTVLPWAIGVAVVAGAVVAAKPVRNRFARLPATGVTAVLVVAAVVAAAGATWTVIDVGHSGAKSAWDHVTDEEGNLDDNPSGGNDRDRGGDGGVDDSGGDSNNDDSNNDDRGGDDD